MVCSLKVIVPRRSKCNWHSRPRAKECRGHLQNRPRPSLNGLVAVNGSPEATAHICIYIYIYIYVYLFIFIYIYRNTLVQFWKSRSLENWPTDKVLHIHTYIYIYIHVKSCVYNLNKLILPTRLRGSGKTLAFLCPGLARVLSFRTASTPSFGPYVLIVAPTRNLGAGIRRNFPLLNINFPKTGVGCAGACMFCVSQHFFQYIDRSRCIDG